MYVRPSSLNVKRKKVEEFLEGILKIAGTDEPMFFLEIRAGMRRFRESTAQSFEAINKSLSRLALASFAKNIAAPAPVAASSSLPVAPASQLSLASGPSVAQRPGAGLLLRPSSSTPSPSQLSLLPPSQQPVQSGRGVLFPDLSHTRPAAGVVTAAVDGEKRKTALLDAVGSQKSALSKEDAEGKELSLVFVNSELSAVSEQQKLVNVSRHPGSPAWQPPTRSSMSTAGSTGTTAHGGLGPASHGLGGVDHVDVRGGGGKDHSAPGTLVSTGPYRVIAESPAHQVRGAMEGLAHTARP